jgi:transposase
VLVFAVGSAHPTAACGRCGAESSKTHGGYRRTVADVPVAGRRVQLDVGVRRFRCVNPGCPAVTFAEQIPGLTAPFARRTAALTAALTAIALSLAGRAGSRLAAALGMTAGRDLLLALIRALPDPQIPELSVLGIDDFALRRGHRYGTILIDMDTHRPIDVLPDRESATVAEWLAARPGISTVCRDRAGAYAEAVRTSLPDAIQVADRYHLWRNLGEAVDKTVRAHHHCLRTASAEPPELGHEDTAVDVSATAVPLNAYGHPSKLAARTIERHALVRDLIAQGHSMARIAREQGLDPRTVKRFATAEHPDQLLGRALGRSGLLEPHKPYLLERIAAGCTQANTLHAELQARGWRGSIQTVRRFVFPLRAAQQLPPPPPPRVRAIVRWIMTNPDHLHTADASALGDIRARCPELDALARHVSTFATMMRELGGQDLRTWCANLHADDLPAMHALADGFLRDEAAVTAGLTLPWNSGPVEGAVTRIKLLKRQCFGRSKFDLLRKRILLAS